MVFGIVACFWLMVFGIVGFSVSVIGLFIIYKVTGGQRHFNAWFRGMEF